MAKTEKRNKGTRKGKFALALLAVCVALIIGLVVLTSLSDTLRKSDSPEGITVTDSGSTHGDITAHVSGAFFTGFDPCIKLRWKNNSDGRCIYGTEYDIQRRTQDGGWESTLTDNIWDSPAFILEKGMEKEEKYAVSDSVLPEAGEYRFITWFYTENNGDEKLKHSAFVDFTLENGVPEQQTRELSVKEMLYDNGSLPEAIPDIKIAPDMTLLIKTAEGWETAGVFGEIRLSKDNFDSRIWHSEVTDQISAVDVRSENKRAWQLYREGTDPEGAGLLYVLLEQADGSLLFAEGEYNVSTAAQENHDSSYFQWIGMIS